MKIIRSHSDIYGTVKVEPKDRIHWHLFNKEHLWKTFKKLNSMKSNKIEIALKLHKNKLAALFLVREMGKSKAVAVAGIDRLIYEESERLK